MLHGAIKWFLMAIAAGGWLVPSTDAIARVPLLQQSQYVSARDSIRQAQLAEKKRLADSIKHVQDSLIMQFIGMPDPERPNQLADRVRKQVVVQNGDFRSWLTLAQSLERQIETNQRKASREPWMLGTIGMLLLLLGIVRVSFPNQVYSIAQAFYNDRMLFQINKEDTLYSSWPF